MPSGKALNTAQERHRSTALSVPKTPADQAYLCNDIIQSYHKPPHLFPAYASPRDCHSGLEALFCD